MVSYKNRKLILTPEKNSLYYKWKNHFYRMNGDVGMAGW